MKKILMNENTPITDTQRYKVFKHQIRPILHATKLFTALSENSHIPFDGDEIQGIIREYGSPEDIATMEKNISNSMINTNTPESHD